MDTQNEKEKWDAIRKNLTREQLAAEEKNNPPIDNPEKNSYITDTGSTQEDSTNKLIKETFKDDVNKLAEAYINSQKSAVKMAQELKALKQLEQSINEMGQKDPMFIEIIDAVKKGESIRSLLEKNEPKGKQDAPVKVDKPDITDKDLLDMGLITEDQLKQSSSFEKQFLKYQAQLMQAAELAKNEVLRSTQEVQKKQQEEAEKQRLQKLAEERYDKSLEAVVTKYGIDFAGEHAALLDEIHEEMAGFRDPKDPRVIHPKAFELAFQNVAERKNIQLEKQSFTRPGQIKTDSSAPVGKKPDSKPKTIEELLLERQAKKFQDYQEKTKGLYKSF